MRVLLCLAFLLPAPVLAETLLATSKVTAVTIYPQGAQVTREVRLTAAPGVHEVLITDLPSDTSPELIRLSPLEGLQVGAFALRSDRLPPREEVLSEAQVAAKAEVEMQEAAVQEVLAVLGGIDAQVAAAEATAAFLQRVQAGGEGETVQSLRETAAMIGAEVLVARQAALAAEQARPAAEKALVKAQEGLAKAQAALEALAQGDREYAALTVAVTVPESGAVALDVTHYVGQASWQPIY
ncbi:MAG: DUF4140 domain-containing protein, partial [Paracoccaceae bacterium]